MPYVKLHSPVLKDHQVGDIVEVTDHDYDFLTFRGYAVGVEAPTEPEPPTKPEPPSPTDDKATWAAHAEQLGIDTDGMKKADIIAAVEQHQEVGGTPSPS